MNNEQQWIEETINSASSIKRATPPKKLLNNILQTIDEKTEHRIPVQQLKWLAAAAAIIALLNVMVLTQQYQQTQSTNQKISETSYLTAPLIKDFNWYSNE